ncbi:MAG: glycosyltransferase family 4 protein [Tepidisphaeraceae bacterium]
MTVATPDLVSSAIRKPSRAIGRIVIATINREEGDTGVHTHTRMLAGGLREAGVACEVVSAFSGGRKWQPVFAVRPLLLHWINKTWSTLWHRRWHGAALRESLRRYVATHRPDVVIAQCPVSARAALDVRGEMRGEFSVVLVCHFNGSEASEYRDKGELAGERHYGAMLAFEDRMLEEVDRVIYVSGWARQSVEGARGVRTKSSAVIWNGLTEPAGGATLTREEIGLANDDLALVNVGSLEPRKNQLELIDLFAQLQAEFPSARLVLVGDGPARGEIESKIAGMKLENVVRVLGHRRDVPGILMLADLYVHYAALENCPLALLEAARAGLAFAAVSAGGVPELQAALDCRIDLSPHDLGKSLENLRPLVQNERLRRDLGDRVRQKFRDRFTARAMTRGYLGAIG